MILLNLYICFGILYGCNAIQDMIYMVTSLKEYEDSMIEQVLLNSKYKVAVAVNNDRIQRGAFYQCINQLDERSCLYFASFGFCSTRKALMEKSCKKTCKFCAEVSCQFTKFGCCFDGKTAATGPNLQGCEDDCKDIYKQKICEALQRRGECLKPGSDIRRKCAVTCGYCRPCVDKDPYECQLTAQYGVCSSNVAVAAERCRKSCKLCGSKDPCFNHICPKHSVCKVRSDGHPVCHCDGKCHEGDHYTGVICGRDGIEYQSLCELKQRNCDHPSVQPVTVKRYGSCQQAGWQPGIKKKICDEKRKDPALCSQWVAAGFCNTRKKSMRTICPKSCNFCAVQTAKPACHYTKHGCCLDNKSPCQDTNYKGCPRYPACRDFSRVFCKRFVAVCGSHKHKSSMRHYCPKTCKLC